MRRLVLGLALLASASGLVAKDYGPAGCGLGTEVIFQDANEWHEHVLAATTNGTSGNQTFGMTSGTLGCETDGPLAKGISVFFGENYEQLAADISRGDGETLDAFAELIGVDAQDNLHFKMTLQNNFDSIFSADAVTADASLSAVIALMSSDENLVRYLG